MMHADTLEAYGFPGTSGYDNNTWPEKLKKKKVFFSKILNLHPWLSQGSARFYSPEAVARAVSICGDAHSSRRAGE